MTVDYRSQARFFTRLPTADLDWHTHAACKELPNEWFFPTSRELAERALAVCVDCPVTDECRGEQRRLRSSGVWGGRYYPAEQWRDTK